MMEIWKDVAVSRKDECLRCRNAELCKAGNLDPPPREIVGDCGHSDGCDSWIPDWWGTECGEGIGK